MAGSGKSYDLPYTTKREAGCFFLLLLILAKIFVVYRWIINESDFGFFLWGTLSLLLTTGIFRCCSLVKYTFDRFRKSDFLKLIGLR